MVSGKPLAGALGAEAVGFSTASDSSCSRWRWARREANSASAAASRSDLECCAGVAGGTGSADVGAVEVAFGVLGVAAGAGAGGGGVELQSPMVVEVVGGWWGEWRTWVVGWTREMKMWREGW